MAHLLQEEQETSKVPMLQPDPPERDPPESTLESTDAGLAHGASSRSVGIMGRGCRSCSRPGLVIASVCLSVTLALLGGAGLVLAMGGRQDVEPRHLSDGGSGGSVPSASHHCSEPGCAIRNLAVRVSSWPGWEVLPFVESTSTTTTTTTMTSTVTTTTTTTTTATTTSTYTGTSTTKTSTKTTTTTSSTTPCMVPAEGDYCYGEVVDAMYDIRENPDNYDGLNVWSSFEEVQDYLATNTEDSSCWLSCRCETAVIGSPCYDAVLFARKRGVKENPEWYPALDEYSSFEDFQSHLWTFVNESECTRPCKASWRSDPSMFCWSVSRNFGYEADVMKVQLEAGAGIFSCDGFAVVSEQDWTVGDGPGKRIGTVKTVTFSHADVGMSKDGTAANTELFMNAWRAVIDKTFILEYDWALKVDPDAVVVVDRLRNHLSDKSGKSLFVRNCNKVPESPDFPMMFGSLEVLSRSALQTYADNDDRCKKELDWYSWGEDFFLGKCLPHLGVQPTDDFSIISDGVCQGVNCHDQNSAAFHPFKSSEDWLGCWNTITAGQGGAPPPLP